MRERKHSYFGIIITLLLVAVLGLAGCNSNSENASESKESKASSGKADKQERVIKHAMGTTKVEGTPKRVVILSNEGTEALLALGVKPVGAVKSWLGDPWYDHIKDQMTDVEVIGDEMQPNLEQIASLKPDLIIGVKVRQEKVYDQLSAIAPTVFSAELSGNWKENFLLYADALNKKAEGEKLVADFDNKITETKDKLGSKTSSKVSIVRFLPESARIYFKDSFSGVILDQLGFSRPAAQNKDGFAEEVTKERIPEMDGDVLFYFIWEDDMKAKTGAKNAAEWKKEKLWTNLKAVKDDKAFEVPEAIWNTSGGILSANLMLDDLIKYFE